MFGAVTPQREGEGRDRGRMKFHDAGERGLFPLYRLS
jgi:hypothetical protein